MPEISLTHSNTMCSPVTPSPSSIGPPRTDVEPTALIRPRISSPATSARGVESPSLGVCSTYDLRFDAGVEGTLEVCAAGTLSALDGPRGSAFSGLPGLGESLISPRFEGKTTDSFRERFDGILRTGFLGGASSSSQPSPPEAIRGRCRPSRRLSALLMDPYLPPDDGADKPAGDEPEDDEAVLLEPDNGVENELNPDGTYRGAGADGGVTIDRVEPRVDVGVAL